MSQENEKLKPTDDMELRKPQASACSPGCGCHAPGAATGKTRWVVGAIILVAAAALAGRALLKDNGTASPSTEPVFAAPPATETAAVTTIAVAVAPQTETPAAAVAATPQPVAAAETVAGTPPADSAKVATPKAEPVLVVGKELAAFTELNTVAADTNAVFVFLPAKAGEPGKPPTAQMEGAARTIAEKGSKVGLFTLKLDSLDYAEITKQAAVPGVLVLVKGSGMKAVSGEITETKLVQAYVAALNAGGCAPGSSSCGPASAGCK